MSNEKCPSGLDNMWLYESKSNSLINTKSSLSSNNSIKVPTEDKKSFILEPDEILAERDRKYTPSENIESAYTSLMTGFLMKWISTKDALHKVYLVNIPDNITKSDVISDTKDDDESVVLASCQNKPRRKKKRSTRKTKCWSTSDLAAEATIKEVGSHEGTTAINVEEEQENANSLKESISSLLATSTKGTFVESYYIERKLESWAYQERDQEAEIIFKTGNRYTGRISRALMEGEGIFQWSNGTIYKGQFKYGNANGSGSIYWPDGSYYEGQVACNKRHGQGIMRKFTKYGEFTYYGYWNSGKKHGKGGVVYAPNNWYEGEWNKGRKEGFGTRNYDSGCRYCGYWKKGLRSGHGIMVWSNKDVYNGSWKNGFMHGIGKYTWKSFRNTQFVFPRGNVLTAEFFDGKVMGFGELQLSCGAVVCTQWLFKEKTGSGEVICTNGERIFDRNLFYKDKAIKVDVNEIEVGLSDSQEDYIELLNLLDEQTFKKVVLPRSININAPVQEMDFSMHIQRLFILDLNVKIKLRVPKRYIPDDQDKLEILQLETQWLRKVVMKQMALLTTVYEFYSELSTESKPKFKCFMMRIMLWQLLRDCRLVETGLTGADIDMLVGLGTNPFDKILLFEMVHYLLTLCWHLWLEPKNSTNESIELRFNKLIPGIIASSFDMFLEQVVTKAIDHYDGTFLRGLDCLPINSIYKLYLSLPQPVTVYELCKAFISTANYPTHLCEEVKISKYYQHILQGKNVIQTDGAVLYASHVDPTPDLILEGIDYSTDSTSFISLNTFASMGPTNIVEAVKPCVPLHLIEETTGEIQADSKLTFLDFCDILVRLADIYLKEVKDYLALLLTKTPIVKPPRKPVDSLEELKKIQMMSQNIDNEGGIMIKYQSRKVTDLMERNPSIASRATLSFRKNRKSTAKRKPKLNSQSSIEKEPSSRDSIHTQNIWRPKKVPTKDIEIVNYLINT